MQAVNIFYLSALACVYKSGSLQMYFDCPVAVITKY